MNIHRSRSKAVFSVNIAINHKTDNENKQQAQLHLVNLAGSERPKKLVQSEKRFKKYK